MAIVKMRRKKFITIIVVVLAIGGIAIGYQIVKRARNVMKENKTELSILTLNLHTYQEKDQEDKFDEIVEFIDSEDVDIICFQETAQHKDSNFIPGSKQIREDNMAYIISNKLSSKGKKILLLLGLGSLWLECMGGRGRYPFQVSVYANGIKICIGKPI